MDLFVLAKELKAVIKKIIKNKQNKTKKNTKNTSAWR